MKRVIIGGSSSTGSSLLNNVMGRNSGVSSTIETSLFCKRELFEDFNKNKGRIFYRFPFGLPNYGHHLYRKIDLNLIKGITRDEILSSVKISEDFQTFSDEMFGKNGKEVWIEKTPGNACNFELFLKNFNQSYVIHTIRNPYDALTSMLLRGYSEAYAAGIYFLNTVCALNASGMEGYIEVRYESFTRDPGTALQKVFNKIGLVYDGSETIPSKESIDYANISSWNKDEMGVVEPNENRFENESEDVQQRVLHIVDFMKISKKGAKYYKIPEISFKDLVVELGYEIKHSSQTQSFKSLESSLSNDRKIRLGKMYFSHYFNYPLELIR